MIEPERLEDERGFFARIFDDEIFDSMGLEPAIRQCSISFNKEMATMRGMHYQRSPHQEAKLIRCTKGRIFDVVVDLRDESESRLRWHGEEISAENRVAVFAPQGAAHGFLTLEPGTEVEYFISTPYLPDLQAGLRWDDPSLAIKWPLQPRFVSKRDQAWPLLSSG